MAPNHGNAFTSFGVPGVVGGWVELARTTLGSANANISVASLPDKRYYKVLVDVAGESSNSDFGVRFNSDSATNYANRVSFDGSGDATAANAALASTFTTDTASTTPVFHVTYIANLAGKEKLVITPQGVRQMTLGAGNAPQRSENVAKWANTVDPIDEITLTTGGAPTFNTGSQVVVLGWDPADTHTTNFWEELASVDLSGGAAATLSSGTITAKKYLWVQYFIDRTTTDQPFMTFNSDTTSYSERISTNGGADTTQTSQANFEIGNSAVADLPQFGNTFIVNNSANEKLVIQHTCAVNGIGAGVAPRRVEMVSKWDETASQITELILGASAGNYDSNTRMTVWGSN